ncbi:MAG: hypothetical protein H6Q20_913 [Bacteroidetes bacterium]|jgi:hypothetical protein|nr:hypothetical protein [Bacteroidota bacterium]
MNGAPAKRNAVLVFSSILESFKTIYNMAGLLTYSRFERLPVTLTTVFRQRNDR